jgi:plasmid rolling circle replication initiator protein Rep
MENLTPAEIWTAILGIASAFVLLANAAEKIGKAIRTAKAPNVKQDERITDLEEWRKGVDQKLENDKTHLDTIDEGNRATQRALLALLDHGIDGNNIEQMQNAKKELQNHLINR